MIANFSLLTIRFDGRCLLLWSQNLFSNGTFPSGKTGGIIGLQNLVSGVCGRSRSLGVLLQSCEGLYELNLWSFRPTPQDWRVRFSPFLLHCRKSTTGPSIREGSVKVMIITTNCKKPREMCKIRDCVGVLVTVRIKCLLTYCTGFSMSYISVCSL